MRDESSASEPSSERGEGGAPEGATGSDGGLDGTLDSGFDSDPRFALPRLPESGPVSSFHLRRRIEFSDTDLAGIVHFSRYTVFMESAEHELLRALGWGVHFDHGEHDDHPAGWPRLACTLAYKSPARFGHELDIKLDVLHKGTSSMVYGITFSVDQRLVALGSLSVACCLMAPGKIQPVPMPAALAHRLAPCDAERARRYDEVRLPRHNRGAGSATPNAPR